MKNKNGLLPIFEYQALVAAFDVRNNYATMLEFIDTSRDRWYKLSATEALAISPALIAGLMSEAGAPFIAIFAFPGFIALQFLRLLLGFCYLPFSLLHVTVFDKALSRLGGVHGGDGDILAVPLSVIVTILLMRQGRSSN
ncbi:hypothetical protein [Terriglobus tenax]|uniref:hypothetical protein n=1 Tax=Terriglobus tenax TaxID=1111115 RepID=UPI0021E04EAF|nr:hypothetical protein [Terriglobus tenax]